MDPLSLALMLASKFAPDIIKHFTNSDTAADVATKVIDIAKTVSGKDDPQEASDAIQADPALAMQFKTAVMANETELQKAYLSDTQNARQQTIDLAKVESKIAWGAPLISALVVGGYFLCIFLLFAKGDDMLGNIFQLVNVMFGGLSIAFGQVCNYWLGSSASSKRNGDAMRDIAVRKN